MKYLAKLTPGYVPSDLEALVREASLFAVERYVDLGLNEEKKSEKIEIESTLEEGAIDEAVKETESEIINPEGEAQTLVDNQGKLIEETEVNK